MRKTLHLVLAAASLTALASCAVRDDDFYAYPDDYRATGNYRGAPDDSRRGSDDRYSSARDRAYDDRYGDRDGDGVLNWRDRYPDDPRRF